MIFMKMNDLRFQAYTEEKNQSEKKKSENLNKVVKPFVPEKISKEQAETEKWKPAAFKSFSFNSEKNSDSGKGSQTEKNAQFEKSGESARKAGNEKKVEFRPFTKSDFSKNDFSKQNKQEKNGNQNQRLEKITDYLKSGGLLKVPVDDKNVDGTDSVYRRVAKFLVLIGKDEAAKILPLLPENQIEKIISEISSIRTIDNDEAEAIFTEFSALLKNVDSVGGVDTAFDILQKAYGKDKAELMLKKTIPFEGQHPFYYLNNFDSERIYLLIKDENVGIQALILSYIEPKKSASVINLMKKDEKKAIALRLAKMEPMSPDIISKVDEAVKQKAEALSSEKSENVDGKNALAQILKKMDALNEAEILNSLSSEDPELGTDLRNRLFTLDDVINADDRVIQEKLKNMSEVDIAYLLAAKPDMFRAKILSNISSGRKNEVFDQEEILKPMRKSDVDKVTNAFFAALRKEYEEGHLIIKDRNDDVFI